VLEKIRKLDNAYLYAIITAVSVVFFFSRIYEPSLSGDEAKYALIAKNMLKSGNFLVPSLGFETYFKKPPFFFWLIALSFKVFGVSEFSARFFSAFFGVLDALIIFRLAYKLTEDKLTSLFSSLAFIINFEVVRITTIVRFDSFLLFVNLASLLLLYRPTFLKALLSILLTATGALTKGPMAFISSAALIIHSIYKKNFRQLLILTLVVFASVLPFLIYLIFMAKDYPQFISEFFGKQILGRIEGSLNEGTSRPFFFYERVILKHFWIWNLSFFYLAYLVFTKQKHQIKRIFSIKNQQLFWVFSVMFLVTYIPLHFISLKFTRYSYYLYPFLCFVSSLIVTRTKLLKSITIYSLLVTLAYGFTSMSCPCKFHKDKIKDLRPLVRIGLKNFKDLGLDRILKKDLVYSLFFYYDNLKFGKGKFLISHGNSCRTNAILVYKNYCIIPGR